MNEDDLTKTLLGKNLPRKWREKKNRYDLRFSAKK